MRWQPSGHLVNDSDAPSRVLEKARSRRALAPIFAYASGERLRLQYLENDMAHGFKSDLATRRTVLAGLGCGAFAAVLGGRPAHAASLRQRFAAASGDASVRLGHAAWGRLLERYVKPGGDGVARVGYAAFKAKGRAELADYLAMLQAADPSTLGRPGQIAFWANLYNAKTLDIVLEHYPIRSIKDIDLGGSLLSAFTGGPWSAKVVRVAGIDLSLDDIEHEILRPVFQDARIHYAVNCASIGCPDLQAKPFEPDTLDASLDRAARTYVNHPRGVSMASNGLTVSSIYEWFREDFGGNERGVLKHLSAHADATLAATLSGVSSIAGYAYDWSLNDV